MRRFHEVLEEALDNGSDAAERELEPACSIRAFKASNDLRDEASACPRPPWAAALEVEYPCDVSTVRKAFRRLARTTHPDAGGSHEAFLRVQRVFAEALAAVERDRLVVSPFRLASNSRATTSIHA